MSDSNSQTDEDYSVSKPSEIHEISTNITLPEKSRKRYEKSYQDFMDWRVSKNFTSFKENILLVYFQELAEKFKWSSLTTIYTMLKSTLNMYHEIDIARYHKLAAFLKCQSEGYTKKTSKMFSPEEINKFLKEAPDEMYLATKVALIFGIVGSCTRKELYRTQYKDVQVFGSTILVKIYNTIKKTERCFTLTGDYYEICRKYMELRPVACSNTSFFLCHKSGQFTSQNLGLNRFGTMSRSIADYLNLSNPELYAGRCFCRTSNKVFIETGDTPTMNLKQRPSGRKSVSESEGEDDDSMESRSEVEAEVFIEHEDPIDSKSNVRNQILNSFENKNIDVVNINIPSNATSANVVDGSAPVHIHFNNCTIQNLNNYYNS